MNEVQPGTDARANVGELTLAQIKALQSRKRKHAARLPPLVRQARGDSPVLSYAQERLWFVEQLGFVGSAYNMPLAMQLDGSLDVTALEATLTELCRRHETLRTHFSSNQGHPVQVIAPAGPVTLEMRDLSALAGAERDLQVQQFTNAEWQRPFDLTTGPLFRAALLKLEPTRHVLLLTLHHIVSDGWSLGVLNRELSLLYGAFVQGRASPLPDLNIQYSDYALWQRSWLQGAVLEQQLAYWRAQLQGLPPLQLPTDRPRPAIPSYRGATVPVNLSASLTRQLTELGRAQGATLYMVGLAAFQVLLARYAGQDDIVVGSPIAGRNQERQ